MSTKAEKVSRLINKLNRVFEQERAGDYLVQQATRTGVAVADAAGAAPNAAEFKALLDSLRNAGLIAK